MEKHSFKSGVHPRTEGKTLTADAAIRPFRPTREAVYPLAQHIGAPATPTVAVGDRVLVGQTIAQPGGFVSAAICSAVSGTVKAIEPRQTVTGHAVNAVVIDNDGQFETVPGFGEERDPAALSNEEILNIIRDAGIVGQGGAGFPTYVKLAVKPEEAPDTVIVNGAECEPYLTSDYRMLLERPEQVVSGLKVVLQLFPKARGVIAIEDNKPAAIEVMRQQTAGEERLSVCVLKTKYPQGGERMLIHAVTGRDINSAMLPIKAGCIVLNVSTTASVYNAVCRQIPLISTVMSITGDAVATPCNLEVPTGSSHQELLEFAGGLKGEAEKLISGGPMMGIAMSSLEVPVVKTSSSILALIKDEVAAWEPTACIHCGRCVSVCPERLVPAMMAQAADTGKLDAFEKLSGMECIECGCCTYVCPAKRRLTQSFKFARKAIADNRRKAKAGGGK